MEMSTIGMSPAAGMRSEVSIRVAVRDGISYLASGYFTPPFKVANITEDKNGPLQLMLMCSSPGVLDGDTQSIRVELETSGRLRLHTQSYQRLFQMKKGAVQSMEVRMGPGSSFCWLPHPSVPHAGSFFSGRNKVFLTTGCRLLWGEILTCGRKGNGEVFALSGYHMRTELFIDEQLVLLENVYLRPSVLPVGALGQMEGFTHQASLLIVEDGRKGSRERIEAWMAERVGGMESGSAPGRENELAGIVYGVTEGPAGSLVLRMLGNKAEQLYDRLKEIAELLLLDSRGEVAEYAG
jgi:urease accessory protein